ncbi:MAG TPA: HU family DNA-binding protein [Aggregatilineales bacterium]|nr:HU family DNA-binding protein [Aggregatilineales bacterium]
MHKADLVAAVSKESGLTQTQSAKAVDAVVEAITKALKAGDKVTLTGFGTFEVRKTAARTGTNPKTKQKIQIAAGKRVGFKAGNTLKESVVGKKGAKKK